MSTESYKFTLCFSLSLSLSLFNHLAWKLRLSHIILLVSVPSSFRPVKERKKKIQNTTTSTRGDGAEKNEALSCERERRERGRKEDRNFGDNNRQETRT